MPRQLFPPSDYRLKESIKEVAVVKGFRTYKFKYKWSDEMYVGVMAQDVLKTNPEAIYVGEKGYFFVDYNSLGIEMRMINPGKDIE